MRIRTKNRDLRHGHGLPPLIVYVVVTCLVVVIARPFARREGLLGTIALLAVLLCAIFLWGVLLLGLVRALLLKNDSSADE